MEREFDWIVLLLGLLHFEMNSTKAFMELNWSVFMENIVIGLGFVSDKALKYIRKGSDHHKMWQILEISYLSLTDELLLPYVRHCISQCTTPTIEGYWKYCENILNPNYCYIQQMVFNFPHALMLFRKGCRNNSPEHIVAAKNCMLVLFFGQNHPNCREIVHYDLKQYMRFPLLLKEIVLGCLTASCSNNIGHYQGGDAILEEINREAKQWMIGVPTEAQWERSFRNLDSISKVQYIYFYISFLITYISNIPTVQNFTIEA